MFWNTRRIRFSDSRFDLSEDMLRYMGKTKVFEVYYDAVCVENEFVPIGFCEASLWVKIRHVLHWWGAPILRYPDDFCSQLDLGGKDEKGQ